MNGKMTLLTPTPQKTKNSKYYTDLISHSELLPDEMRKSSI